MTTSASRDVGPFEGSLESPAGLFEAAASFADEDGRAAVVARANAELARCEEAKKDPACAGSIRAIEEHQDQVWRAGRAAQRRGQPGGRMLAENRRVRTNADRQAFLLAEMTSRTQLELREPEPEQRPNDSFRTNASELAAHERAQVRAALVEATKTGLLRFLGEVAFRGVPMDPHEKGPHRAEILAEAERVAAAAWRAPEGGPLHEAAAEVAEAVHGLGSPHLARDAVSAEVAREGSRLRELAEAAGAEIEARTVAAYADAHRRAAEVERRLALTEASSSDPESRRRRALREVKRGGQTLMEALFVANRRHLAETVGAEPSHDIVLGEAVCQYALLETLSAYGMVRVEDPLLLAQTLMRSRAAAARAAA